MGQGTYKLPDCKESVKKAIRAGFKLIDTASLYKNEREVGEAINEMIKQNEIKRDDVQVITKLWNDDHEDPVSALKKSLSELSLDFIDLYLIHWPVGKLEAKEIKQVPLFKTWKILEECVDKGLVKSIGVSNFSVQMLLELLSFCRIKPVVNQIELHPYLTSVNLVNFCKKFDVRVISFNSIVKGTYITQIEGYEDFDLFKNKIIIHLAEKYKKSPAQIILNWHVSRGIVPIPKSSNDERLKENLNSLNFKMSDLDYDLVGTINLNKRFNDPKLKSFSSKIDIFA